jgi:hypothetical protein
MSVMSSQSLILRVPVWRFKVTCSRAKYITLPRRMIPNKGMSGKKDARIVKYPYGYLLRLL